MSHPILLQSHVPDRTGMKLLGKLEKREDEAEGYGVVWRVTGR